MRFGDASKNKAYENSRKSVFEKTAAIWTKRLRHINFIPAHNICYLLMQQRWVKYKA